jgi:hypothetical protein
MSYRKKLTIGLAAERVITVSRAVAGTVALTTGLDPDEGISQAVASAASGADTETGTVDVAPVTPRLAEVLNGVTASIHDSLSGHAVLGEERREGIDVGLLVLAVVVSSIGGVGELSWGEVPVQKS